MADEHQYDHAQRCVKCGVGVCAVTDGWMSETCPAKTIKTAGVITGQSAGEDLPNIPLSERGFGI